MRLTHKPPLLFPLEMAFKSLAGCGKPTPAITGALEREQINWGLLGEEGSTPQKRPKRDPYQTSFFLL